MFAVYTMYKYFTTPPELRDIVKGGAKGELDKHNPLKTASILIGLMPLVGIFSFMLIYSSPESYAFISIVSGGISIFLFYGFVINLYQAGAQNQNPS